MTNNNENPFSLYREDEKPSSGGQAIIDLPEGDLNEKISKLIGSSDIFVFMKGVPDMPQCGFSANVVAILNHLGKNYKTFNVLADWDIREGVKAYSNWPTFPQVYFKGKLLGGNDIITEMFENGDLQDALN